MGFVFLVICAVSLVLLFRKSWTSEHEGLVEYTHPKTGKVGVRRLDAVNFEKGTHDQLYTFGMALDSNVVFIDSVASLSSRVVRKALVMLSKRYPMLRMKFEWIESRSSGVTHRYLTEIEHPNSINFCEEDTECWQERLEEELQTPFDVGVGPLWRVIRLKEQYNGTDNKYKNTLLFTFHHSICDGISIMTLYDQFLEYLNQCYHGNEEANGIESMPLLPPLQDLVKQQITLPCWKAVLFIAKMKLTQLFKSFHRSRNIFLQKFPPVITTNPSVVKRTCIIPRILSKEETKEIEKHCKAHKCTVAGALTASAALALGKIIQGGEIRSPMAVAVCIPVSIRQDCQPVVSKEHFGTFLSPLPCTVWLYNRASQDFWKLSRQISKNIHSQLRSKEQFNYLRRIKYGNMQSAEEMSKVSQDVGSAGRWEGLLEVSNRGKFEVGKTGPRTFEFVGTHFAVAQHLCGSLLTNNVVTVNGHLFWTVVFSSHVMASQLAEKYLDLVFETLTRNISE